MNLIRMIVALISDAITKQSAPSIYKNEILSMSAILV
jgi:hypothetical protein